MVVEIANNRIEAITMTELAGKAAMTAATIDGQVETRRRVRAMWGSVAPHWAEHVDYVDDRARDLTRLMIESASPAPGERVLELACGVGSVGLAVAPLVLPGGDVVVSDVAPEMTDIARRRAAAAGFSHVVARDLDLAEIDEPAAVYDVVFCREGLMFATDPARAVAEIRRVLRPGGRVAISVWGRREDNPWLGLVFDAVTAETGTPVPPTGVPGPFSLADRDHLSGLLRGQFDEARLIDVQAPARAPSFEAWWDRTAALAGPLSKLLASMSATTRANVAERLRAACAPYTTPAGVELPGLALLATAHV